MLAKKSSITRTGVMNRRPQKNVTNMSWLHFSILNRQRSQFTMSTNSLSTRVRFSTLRFARTLFWHSLRRSPRRRPPRSPPRKRQPTRPPRGQHLQAQSHHHQLRQLPTPMLLSPPNLLVGVLSGHSLTLSRGCLVPTPHHIRASLDKEGQALFDQKGKETRELATHVLGQMQVKDDQQKIVFDKNQGNDSSSR